MRVAGVPVDSPEFIANYVRSKALDIAMMIVQDVEKLRITETTLSCIIAWLKSANIRASLFWPGTCPQHK